MSAYAAPRFANYFAIFAKAEVVTLAFTNQVTQEMGHADAGSVVMTRAGACELRNALVHLLGPAEAAKGEAPNVKGMN